MFERSFSTHYLWVRPNYIRNSKTIESVTFLAGHGEICPPHVGRREKTPTPKTRFSIWTLLRNPGRYTARPLRVHFTTKMSVVRAVFGP